SYFMTRLVGPNRAKELLFNAEPLTSQEAYALNIVNHVYEKDKFKEEVKAFTDKIATGPSNAYEFIKKTVNQSLHSNLEDILEEKRISQTTLVMTEDHQEVFKHLKKKETLPFEFKI